MQSEICFNPDSVPVAEDRFTIMCIRVPDSVKPRFGFSWGTLLLVDPETRVGHPGLFKLNPIQGSFKIMGMDSLLFVFKSEICLQPGRVPVAEDRFTIMFMRVPDGVKP